MTTILTQEKLEELTKLAQQAVPKTSPLKGQGDIALLLRDRGFGPRQIANFLKTHGVSCSPTAVMRFLQKNPKPHTEEASKA